MKQSMWMKSEKRECFQIFIMKLAQYDEEASLS